MITCFIYNTFPEKKSKILSIRAHASKINKSCVKSRYVCIPNSKKRSILDKNSVTATQHKTCHAKIPASIISPIQ